MKPTSILLGCVLLSLAMGCMNVPIEGDCPKTPDSKFGTETVHGSYYGFNWDDDTRQVRKAAEGLGLAKVEYRSNFVYALVSVLSLGAYAPVDVDYWVESPDTIHRLPKKNSKTED